MIGGEECVVDGFGTRGVGERVSGGVEDCERVRLWIFGNGEGIVEYLFGIGDKGCGDWVFV